jgi:hypothetical protein
LFNFVKRNSGLKVNKNKKLRGRNMHHDKRPLLS